MADTVPSITKTADELKGSLTTSSSNGSAIDNYGNTWTDASTGIGTPQYQQRYTLSSLGGSSANPYAPANTLGQQNSTGINTTGAGTGSVVSTSAPVVAQEKNTINDVQNLISNDTSGITTSHNDYITMLNERISALDARRASEEQGINNTFNEKDRQLKQNQKGETGTFGATLQRIGGYLGDSASSAGAMINLAEQHTFQINDLESKRQSALQEARNAISDKQFELARLKASEAKDYAKEIQDSKQQFFENNMKILNEKRQADEAQRTAIKDKLTNLAYLTPDKISTQTKAEIDGFYGTPGFTDSYISVTNAAAKAKGEKEVMDARKATLEFLQNIPAGKTITMPDGTSFTGMGKASDVATFMQTDSAGVGHLVTYNKLTGAKSITNLGVVGKGSGGGGSTAAKTDPVIRDNAVNIVQSTLEANKDPKTGQYDPDIYLKQRNLLKESKYPQLVPYMDKLFLDKANGFFNDAAISQLRKKGVYYGDTSLPDPAAVDNNGDTVQSDNQ